jgi:hypothetical protein
MDRTVQLDHIVIRHLPELGGVPTADRFGGHIAPLGRGGTMNREKPDRTERGHGRHLVLESAQSAHSPAPFESAVATPGAALKHCPIQTSWGEGALPLPYPYSL